MAFKNLGWIALGGFTVGFIALSGAYAAGGKERWHWDNVPSWLIDYAWRESCGSDGQAAERRLAWTGSDTIGIAVPGDIHYKVGEGDEIIVRGPANLLDHIAIKNDSIRLACRGSQRGGNLDVTLPGRSFRKIHLAGSSDLIGENLNQETLDIDIAGKGSLRATGSVAHVEVNIAGSGDAYLRDVAMKSLKLNVAGSGNAEAAPTDTVKVNVVGSGNLTLFSNPTDIKTNIVGSGRVIHAAPKGTGI